MRQSSKMHSFARLSCLLVLTAMCSFLHRGVGDSAGCCRHSPLSLTQQGCRDSSQGAGRARTAPGLYGQHHRRDPAAARPRNRHAQEQQHAVQAQRSSLQRHRSSDRRYGEPAWLQYALQRCQHASVSHPQVLDPQPRDASDQHHVSACSSNGSSSGCCYFAAALPAATPATAAAGLKAHAYAAVVSLCWQVVLILLVLLLSGCDTARACGSIGWHATKSSGGRIGAGTWRDSQHC